jgi:predicted nucleic acid-binding protein
MAVLLELEAAVGRHARLLLDTTLLIHEYTRTVHLLRRIPPPQRATSLVAVWEFLHLRDGQVISRKERDARRTWMEEQQIEQHWLSAGSDQAFRNLVLRYQHGVVDCLLAADSTSRGWPLVTNNVQHFEDVPGMFLVPY